MNARYLLVLAALAVCRNGLAGEPFAFSHENVLGTTLELKLNAASPEAAAAAEKEALAEIDRLAGVYSTWDAGSETRRWLAGEATEQIVSTELLTLLTLCDEYRKFSDGAFDPRAAVAIGAWKKAESEKRLPTSEELAQAVAALRAPGWRLEEARHAVFREKKLPLTFDGIAKGLIVDSVCNLLRRAAGITGATVNIGGDLRIVGDMKEPQLAIADPKEPVKPLVKLRLADRALATSGNYFRGFEIQGKHYSHIVDPRTAHPVDHVLSASVLADDLAKADALATAFSVLPVERSLELCTPQSKVACLLVKADGTIVRSSNWPQGSELKEGAPSGPAPRGVDDWNSGAELVVDFEINRADGNRYRRPYVAVWVEDAQEKPVRTLVLWLQSTGSGPRWHRDLKRWYRQDTQRRSASELNLISTISAATKPPGAYKAVWDGKNDDGELVKKGNYKLYIEVAREHGTYQILSQDVVIGDAAASGDVGSNVEIKAAAYSYQPGEAKP